MSVTELDGPSTDCPDTLEKNNRLLNWGHYDACIKFVWDHSNSYENVLRRDGVAILEQTEFPCAINRIYHLQRLSCRSADNEGPPGCVEEETGRSVEVSSRALTQHAKEATTK